MNKIIEKYLKQNDFVRGIGVNEAEMLRHKLKVYGGDESRLLRDIDTYEFSLSGRKVSFHKKETNTFLNVGNFSYFYHGEHYLRYLNDEFGGEEVLTGDTLFRIEYDLKEKGKAKGTFHIPSDSSDRIREFTLSLKENEILSECA